MPEPTDDAAVARAAVRAGELLAPLRARYASWLSLDRAGVVEEREEDPATVRAMQLIVRMERDRPPSWHAALRLAASGAARICLDPRLDVDPLWAEAVGAYVGRHIRKVTRRARGAAWQATSDLAGLTLSEDETELRVLLPGLVGDLDKRVSKLQVGGTDVSIDDPPTGTMQPGSLAVWIPPEPVMTLGKSMAQAGHAGMIAAALLAGDDHDGVQDWYAAGCPVDVRRAGPAEWDALTSAVDDPEHGWRGSGLLACRDAGFTEIEPGTITVIARRPESTGAGQR